MSLSSSLSSASIGEVVDSSLLEAERDDSTSPLHSPSTISASMDDYARSAKVAKAALACGDIKTAVDQFDRALSIELQTEMDCLYDTSLGFVSGLVRQEVDSRLMGSPRYSAGPPSCNVVLEQLAAVYSDTERQLARRPTEAKWYLRMGTCLCVVNEWEKARKIYTEGLNMCKDKDKKELTRALKNLTRIEHIVSGEQQPEPYEVGVYGPLGKVSVSEKAKRKHSLSFSPRRKSRVKSEANDFEPEGGPPQQPRHRSLSHRPLVRERKVSVPSEVEAEPEAETSPHHSKLKKRLTFGMGSFKKRTSNGFFGQREPSVDSEERQAWVEAFSPEASIASGCHGFSPSAIVHMRRLSLESLTPTLASRPVNVDSSLVTGPSYTAVKFQSLQIDGDDSEIED